MMGFYRPDENNGEIKYATGDGDFVFSVNYLREEICKDIDIDDIANLPLIGRNFLEFLKKNADVVCLEEYENYEH